MTGSMRTFVTERGEERGGTEAILKDQSVGPKITVLRKMPEGPVLWKHRYLGPPPPWNISRSAISKIKSTLKTKWTNSEKEREEKERQRGWISSYQLFICMVPIPTSIDQSTVDVSIWAYISRYMTRRPIQYHFLTATPWGDQFLHTRFQNRYLHILCIWEKWL